jgi:hypothetical protein
MSSRREIVERKLDVKLPEQYALFLNKYGIYDAPGAEVYGMDDNLEHLGPPCVIGATERYRRDDGMPHRFLMVHSTGFDGEIMCLDTENGNVYSIRPGYPAQRIADSFDQWFDGYILRPPHEIRERREWLIAYWKQRAKEFLEMEGAGKEHKTKQSTKRKEAQRMREFKIMALVTFLVPAALSACWTRINFYLQPMALLDAEDSSIDW